MRPRDAEVVDAMSSSTFRAEGAFQYTSFLLRCRAHLLFKIVQKAHRPGRRGVSHNQTGGSSPSPSAPS